MKILFLLCIAISCCFVFSKISGIGESEAARNSQISHIENWFREYSTNHWQGRSFQRTTGNTAGSRNTSATGTNSARTNTASATGSGSRTNTASTTGTNSRTNTATATGTNSRANTASTTGTNSRTNTASATGSTSRPTTGTGSQTAATGTNARGNTATATATAPALYTVPAEELLANSCRGDDAKIQSDLTKSSSILTLREWNTNPNRKKFYEPKCGCPGISAYTDNKRLPFKYMQCCLRNSNSCPAASHGGIHEVIKLASAEIAAGKCRGTAKWANRAQSGFAKDGFLYRGQTSFWGADLTKILAKGAVWRYLAFTSFSYDLPRAAGYSNGNGSRQGTYIIRVSGNNKLNGLFIEKCSWYPDEREFLVDKNSCFRVKSPVTKIKTNWVYESNSGRDWEFNYVDVEPINCSEAKTYDYTS